MLTSESVHELVLTIEWSHYVHDTNAIIVCLVYYRTGAHLFYFIWVWRTGRILNVHFSITVPQIVSASCGLMGVTNSHSILLARRGFQVTYDLRMSRWFVNVVPAVLPTLLSNKLVREPSHRRHFPVIVLAATNFIIYVTNQGERSGQNM